MAEQTENTIVTPDFHYVLIDETEYFRKDIQKKAGKIFGVYLVDKNRYIYPCSIVPHYELHFIQQLVSENGYENFTEDELTNIEYFNGDGEEVRYVSIHFSFFKEERQQQIEDEELREANENDEDYEKIIEELKGEYLANPVF